MISITSWFWTEKSLSSTTVSFSKEGSLCPQIRIVSFKQSPWILGRILFMYIKRIINCLIITFITSLPIFSYENFKYDIVGTWASKDVCDYYI